MGDVPAQVGALLAGVVLGVFFFGSLRWTVDRAMSSEHPAGWFVGSLLVRTSIALAGFFVVGQGRWERIVACLVGFAVARFLVLGRTTRAPVHHAP